MTLCMYRDIHTLQPYTMLYNLEISLPKDVNEEETCDGVRHKLRYRAIHKTERDLASNGKKALANRSLQPGIRPKSHDISCNRKQPHSTRVCYTRNVYVI